MPKKVDIRIHKILSLLDRERSLLAWLVSRGLNPSHIYNHLCKHHPDVHFSLGGFLNAFRRLEPELYEHALRNRNRAYLSVQAYHEEIREQVNAGYSLKQIHDRICPHITYSVFIARLREHDPDLHFRARQNGLKIRGACLTVRAENNADGVTS